MKKIVLILTLGLAVTGADAQKIDKTLLCGKWMLNCITVQGRNLCKDSMNLIISTTVKNAIAGQPGLTQAQKDSLQMVATTAKSEFSDLFKTYAKFEPNGSCSMPGAEKNENGSAVEETGRYIWTADNKITMTLGRSVADTLVISNLTAHTLTLSPESGDGAAMCFIKH